VWILVTNPQDNHPGVFDKAWIDHRTIEDHRAADQSDGTWGSASDAIHIVVPSIAGYGFSGRPTVTGWGTEHEACAWFVLVKRLGYMHFVAQGGVIGSVVTTLMGEQAPPELFGIHTNLPATVLPAIAKSLACGDPRRVVFQPTKSTRTSTYSCCTGNNSPMPRSMRTRPQTLYHK
jgi:hypothetical protein